VVDKWAVWPCNGALATAVDSALLAIQHALRRHVEITRARSDYGRRVDSRLTRFATITTGRRKTNVGALEM
jgi:hypothetical protein